MQNKIRTGLSTAQCSGNMGMYYLLHILDTCTLRHIYVYVVILDVHCDTTRKRLSHTVSLYHKETFVPYCFLVPLHACENCVYLSNSAEFKKLPQTGVGL